jgi:hypothetical protein
LDSPPAPSFTIRPRGGCLETSLDRRYDIQDGRDIRRAAEIMEQQLAQKKAISPISSTIDPKTQVDPEVPKASKLLN